MTHVKKHFYRTLLILAVMIQAMIPVGFMPAYAADGGMMMVICAGDDFKTVRVDVDGDETHQSDNANPCAFSLTVPAITASNHSVLFVAPTGIHSLLPAAANGYGQYFYLSAPSRAPPLLIA